MDIIKFKELSDFLKTGREIEFDYNGQLYYIVNNNGEWYLGCNNKNILTLCLFNEKDILVNKIASFKINGVTIEYIFDNLMYNIDSLYIL